MAQANRKMRSDSVAGQVRAFQVAKDGPPLEWPHHLIDLPADETEQKQALQIFHDMQMSRDPDWWRPHHALQIAELSLLMGQRSKLTVLLAKSGPLTSQNGRLTRSPVLDALTQLTGAITQQLKPLGISPTQLERDHHSRGILNATERSNDDKLSLLA